MPGQLIKVRPTKIELIRLRRRLRLANRIQRIVKDRLSILIMEFLQVAKETIDAKGKSLELFQKAYQALAVATGYHGFLAMDKELVASEREMTLATGLRSVAGLRIPSIELKIEERAMPGYAVMDTSARLDRAQVLFRECLDSVAELAELQSSLEILGREINRTKRIVNALEYMIIPSLATTIKFLQMKFEERDREEKSRLKRVKVLLGQR
ncbi:MAG: V-type ATP synthase subunit D [Chloroflexota bacterium]